MLVHCSREVIWDSLYCTNDPINPEPTDAEVYLSMPEEFVQAVANGWDDGVFYGDCDDFNREFSGFLISISLRPADRIKQLGA